MAKIGQCGTERSFCFLLTPFSVICCSSRLSKADTRGSSEGGKEVHPGVRLVPALRVNGQQRRGGEELCGWAERSKGFLAVRPSGREWHVFSPLHCPQALWADRTERSWSHFRRLHKPCCPELCACEISPSSRDKYWTTPHSLTRHPPSLLVTTDMNKVILPWPQLLARAELPFFQCSNQDTLMAQDFLAKHPASSGPSMEVLWAACIKHRWTSPLWSGARLRRVAFENSLQQLFSLHRSWCNWAVQCASLSD